MGFFPHGLDLPAGIALGLIVALELMLWLDPGSATKTMTTEQPKTDLTPYFQEVEKLMAAASANLTALQNAVAALQTQVQASIAAEQDAGSTISASSNDDAFLPALTAQVQSATQQLATSQAALQAANPPVAPPSAAPAPAQPTATAATISA